MNMVVCNRCGATHGVVIDVRCQLCGPVPLCSDCYNAHLPNAILHARPASPTGRWGE